MGHGAVLESRPVARKPNKVTGKDPVRVNYYLPAELMIRVEKFAQIAKKQDPLGRDVTRTDAIKALIERALDAEGIK
jgi:hypothetical protein